MDVCIRPQNRELDPLFGWPQYSPVESYSNTKYCSHSLADTLSRYRAHDLCIHLKSPHSAKHTVSLTPKKENRSRCVSPSSSLQPTLHLPPVRHEHATPLTPTGQPRVRPLPLLRRVSLHQGGLPVTPPTEIHGCHEQGPAH